MFKTHFLPTTKALQVDYCVLLLVLTASSVLVISSIVSTFYFNDKEITRHFAYLASSLSEGKLYFPDQVDKHDTVFYKNHYFWPLGPLPIILLLPFAFFMSVNSVFMVQSLIQIILIISTAILIFKIAKSLNYSDTESIYWVCAYLYGSVFFKVALAATSYEFAQVVVTFLLFLLLYEYYVRKRKRILLISLLVGLLLATRITAGFTALVFVFVMLFYSNNSLRQKVAQGILFTVFPTIFILLIGLYNYLRFDNFFESGYSMQNINPCLRENFKQGMISVKHIPANIYYFLINSPEPVFKNNNSHILVFPYIRYSVWGMGLFFSSPYLIYLLFCEYRKQISRVLIITSVLSAIPIFLYYGIGYLQFGYRYSLDFLPFVFLLLIHSVKSQFGQIPLRLRILMLLAAILNGYLILTKYHA